MKEPSRHTYISCGYTAQSPALNCYLEDCPLQLHLGMLVNSVLAACVGAYTCLAGCMIAKRCMEKEKRTLVVGPEQR
jgi:hypothetical protein